MATQPLEPGTFNPWIDRRAGARDRRKHLESSPLGAVLNEPIPGGASLAYVLWIWIALSLFVASRHLDVSGALLRSLRRSCAHDRRLPHERSVHRVRYPQHSCVWFKRDCHRLAAARQPTFLYGAYKGRRKLLWLAGCVLFALMLGMSFTGYLLPWDQKAYFATTVGTNILSYIPVIGGPLKSLLRGGTEMGTLTLSRFFVLHVFLIPGPHTCFYLHPRFLVPQSWTRGTDPRRAKALKQSTEPF